MGFKKVFNLSRTIFVTGLEMSDVRIKVPSGISKKIAKFELENELERKKRKLRSMKTSIRKLGLSKGDVERFEEAREKAWEQRKKSLL
ncbi:hypothetical protein AKJ50_00395 [candidate division MSBL1 archaeon SCGC-AAA382A13]|uniref:Uncharacterized protein n=1 Tax=candidate division MSBL1 archaeon SCGC-AAA382A13 TaxID=1698279 RepID=A0A133VGR3_9EURY|nr:hypothetical protein AKJ50_00395 [candidate division MSBL1 archaeon SCGC-AAA382A13]